MKKIFVPIVLAVAGMNAWAGSPYNAVVAADGSGDYLTVSEAIAAAPVSSENPWLILVKKGDYRELVRIPADKPNIHLIGQGTEHTSIHFPLNYGGKPDNNPRYGKTEYWIHSINNPSAPVYRGQSAVVDVNAPGFMSSGIAYVNDWGTQASSGPQALAMYSNADRVAFGDCSFRSFQDTWRTPDSDSARNYVVNSLIEGAVDYIYGGGDVYVENSTLYNVRSGSVIVAPSHGTPAYGYVFSDCTIDGTPEAADGTQKLGRPWKRAPRTVYLNTVALIPISEAGWDDMGTVPALFAEYNTMRRDGTPVDLSKRKSEYHPRKGKNGVQPEPGTSQTALTAGEAANYTYDNVVKSRDGWDPRTMLAQIAAPTKLTLDGDVLSWEPVEGAIGYIVYDGDNIVATTTDTSAKVSVPVKCSFKVRAVNPSGVPGKLCI